MNNTEELEMTTLDEFMEAFLAQVRKTQCLSHIVTVQGPNGIQLVLRVEILDASKADCESVH